MGDFGGDRKYSYHQSLLQLCRMAPQPLSPSVADGIGQLVSLPLAAPSSTVGESAKKSELNERRLLVMTKSDGEVTSRQDFLLFQPTWKWIFWVLSCERVF